MTETEHFFGGRHTEAKLACLRNYLHAYAQALKRKKFRKIYIDAFAGTGSRTELRAALPILGSTEAEVVTTEGSAAIALGVIPAFDHIVLIEQDAEKMSALQATAARSGHPSVRIVNGDANALVRYLCETTNWRRASMRGVIFLDPYGMEVEWATLKAIAATRALDCWYFFPLSGLYRNAPHDPARLDERKTKAINRVLGTEDWKNLWYGRPPQMDFLDDQSMQLQREATVDDIENYVAERLRTVFPGPVLEPLRLRNSENAPLASLFFAMSNPNDAAVELGTRIANHILAAGRSSQIRSR